MKKLFAMFLALTMTFQLITPAWADAAEASEEVTEAAEVVGEVEEPEKEIPEEETTEATEEARPEETTEATEEETEVTEPIVEELPEEEKPIMEEVPEEEDAFQTEEGVIASGTCGDDLTWVLTEDGTLTISGSGEMGRVHYDNPWEVYGQKIERIIIEPGVTSISYWAFHAYSDQYMNLHSIVIPESVTTIGAGAFHGCYGLREVTFGHRCGDPLSIGDEAFERYSSDGSDISMVIRVPSTRAINEAITSVYWGRDRIIHYIGTGNFPMESISIMPKDSVSEVELGTSVPMEVSLDPVDTTDEYTLSIVPEKTTANANISKNGILTTLSTGTVTVRAECVGRPELYSETTLSILPPTGSLTSISVTTLNDYPGEAELGKPVQMVPVFTPANAAERTVTWSLENGSGTATIDRNGLLTPLTAGTVTVYATAANGAEGSCTVNIQRYADGITILLNGEPDVHRLGIGEEVELSAILSPDDTTTKDVSWLVLEQTGTAKLTIWDSYSKLEGMREGTVLLRATAKDSKQVIAEKQLIIVDSIRTYALPDGSGNLYYNTETGWITGADATLKDVVIPAQIDGVTIVGISPYVFAHRYSDGSIGGENQVLASVSIPASITEIGEHAFANCTAMSTLRFANGSKLKRIGESAFEYCTKLSSLTIPEGTKEFGKNAFSMLNGLKRLTISGELDTKNITWYSSSLDFICFTGSYIRGRIKTGDQYYSVEDMPFRDAKQIVISETVKSIGDNAFFGCTSIEQVDIKGDLQSIGEGAFYYCSKLATINLPNSLQSIGKGCFQECDNLQIIDVSKAPDVILEKKTYLTNMAVIPETLIRATNGQTDIRWWLKMEGEHYTYVAQDYKTNEWYIYAHESGQYRLICEDTYTGARGSKLIEIKTGTVIRPADTGYLVSGGKLTLSAWNMPEETKANVFWSLAAGGQNYASIDNKGVLTAKTVYSARQVTVLARPYDGGETVSKTIWILPKTTGLGLLLDGAPLGSTLNVDQAETGTLALSAQVYPEGALQEVQWSSSAEAVARVDENGLVTLAKPGTAVIKATTKDGSKLTAQVTLNVTFLDPSTTMTLTGEIPQPGLEPWQTVQLTLKGTMAIDPERVTFSVPSNQSAMGSIDETGLFTAGDTAGKVTVTAALKNDPLGRKADITIPVVPMQAWGLMLSPNLYGPGQVSIEGEDTLVIFSVEEAASGTAFGLTAEATDIYGNPIEKSIRFTSTDTSIAKVTQEGQVTLVKGAEGLCAIEAKVADERGAAARVLVSVRDYAPRLESNQVALNGASSAGTTLNLLESFDNTIWEVQLSDGRFACAYEDGGLTIVADDTVKKGNYPVSLEVTCANGQVYTYQLTLKVTSTLPKVTVKQQGKFNLFYKDSAVDLTVTTPGAQIETVELTGTEDFRLEEVDGQWKLFYSDPDNVPAKPNNKGTLRVWLEGYREPVAAALNIATVVTAPSAKFNNASSVVNTALSTDRSTYLTLLDKSGKPLELESPYVWTDTDNVTAFWDGSKAVLTLEEAKATNAVVYVQDSSWAMSLKLTHKITVSNKLPTLKPAGNLTLNSLFAARTAETAMVLSQSNLTLVNVEAVPAAKAGTLALTESEKLNIAYDPETGRMAARINDASIKAGTYSFNCTGILETGETISGGTLKVTVSAAAPKVKLSATSVKLNQHLAGREQGTVTVTAPAGYQVVDFTGKSDGMSFDGDTGILSVQLQGNSDKGGTYDLYPVIRDLDTMEEATLPTKLTFKVQTYNSSKLSVSVSAKGKLDTQTDGEITYTVTKLANCLGTVDNVVLEGQDKDLFQADMDFVNGKPTVHLTLVDGITYATNKAYKVQFHFYTCGTEVLSPVQTVKVTQTALKVTVPKTVTYYQAQKSPLRCTLTASAPLADVTLDGKTAKELQTAVGAVTLDGNRVDIEIINSSALTAGKSYSLVLNAIPENNAENVKPVTVKLTVKVMK